MNKILTIAILSLISPTLVQTMEVQQLGKRKREEIPSVTVEDSLEPVLKKSKTQAGGTKQILQFITKSYPKNLSSKENQEQTIAPQKPAQFIQKMYGTSPALIKLLPQQTQSGVPIKYQQGTLHEIQKYGIPALDKTKNLPFAPTKQSSAFKRPLDLAAEKFQIALSKNNVRMVKKLLSEHPQLLNYKYKNGNTPLHEAAENNSLDVVKYLIEHTHVDPNIPSKSREADTPLLIAARNNALDVVKYLIEQTNANPNACNEIGMTPLQDASYYNHIDVVKYLIEHAKANPCITTDGLDQTPLHEAAENNSLDVVKYLIEQAHVDPNILDRDGDTPLHSADRDSCLDVVKYLIENAHANPVIANSYGMPLLHSAANKGSLQLVKYLIEVAQVNPNSPDIKGNTPLHYAAQDNESHVVKYLVEQQKINPITLNKNGATPLHLAAQQNRLNVVKYLVEVAKVPVFPIDSTGKNPWQYAKQAKAQAVLAYITEKRILGNAGPCRVCLKIPLEPAHTTITDWGCLGVIHTTCKTQLLQQPNVQLRICPTCRRPLEN